jgi:uncharacterized protein YndB with AHSA1/START domain
VSDSLEIKRVFDAPREVVFQAWTDPEHLAHWWGPESHPASLIEVDPRPGGTWRGCLSGLDGSALWQHGVFHEVVPPERLVYSFTWDDDPTHEMLVTVRFIERGTKTEMIFTQRMFRSVAERDGHVAGWQSSFNRLDASLAA